MATAGSDGGTRAARLVGQICRVVAGLFIAAAIVLPARAQSNYGSIGGVVTDPSGAVVPGAAVKARNLNTSVTSVATTNQTGLFWLPLLEPGWYEVSSRAAGFATVVHQHVVVSVGSHVALSFSLPLAARSDLVTVDEQALSVEGNRSQFSLHVGERSIRSLPVNGRDFISFVLLTPGVTRDVRGGLSFGGQRGMNSILVDGANDDDHFWDQANGGSAFSPSGRDPYEFSQEAVEEFQVNTNSYSAELGRAGGGVVNVVTKSGTNHFHGSIFWFYRDQSMNANDAVNKRLGLAKLPFHYNQLGGTVGGPLVRKRLFFFLSYEGLRSDVSNSVVLNLPTDFRLDGDPAIAAFQQRALDYLSPRATHWSLPVTQNNYLAKLDWHVTPGHQLSARWSRQNFSGGGIGDATPQNSLEHTNPGVLDGDTLRLSLKSALGQSKVNVASFVYGRVKNDLLGNSVNPEASIFQNGQLVVVIGRAPGAQSIPSQRAQWSDTLYCVSGRHNLRIGADVLLDRITRRQAASFFGRYTFLSLESFGRSLAGVPSPAPGERYIQAFSGDGTHGVVTRPSSTEFAGFIQDEWHVRDTLTLNFGLRYDVQLMASPRIRNPSAALASAGLDTSFLRNDYGNLGPRAGIAWAPRRGDRLVVRSGYGIFFGQTPGLILSGASSQNGISVSTLTFAGSSAAMIPAYPNTICGAPDPSGVPPNCDAPPLTAGNLTLLFFNRNYRQPYTQQGTFGVEVRASKNLSISASYLVVKGTSLQRVRDVNLGVTETEKGIGIAGTAEVVKYRAFAGPRPIAGFDRLLTYASDANSIYHGLALVINKRFSNSFQFLGSYTLSKVIDDAPNVYIGNPGPQDGTMLSDSTNARADRSVGLNDQRHRLVLSGIWELNYGSGLPRIAKMMLSGWQVSGIVTAQSGQPYSGFVSADLNNDGNQANDRSPGQSRNTFYMPATISIDPRLTRTIRFSEQVKLDVIWEAFNVLNRRNVSAVSTTQFSRSTSSSVCGFAGVPCLTPLNAGLNAFGAPTATTGPRIMQLGARLSF